MMLQIFNFIKCIRLPYQIYPAIANLQLRTLCKKSGDGDKKLETSSKKSEPKPMKSVCNSKGGIQTKPNCDNQKPKESEKKEPDCKGKEPEKKKEPVKKEPDCKAKEPEKKKESEKKKEPDCKTKEPEKKKEPDCKTKEPEKKKEPDCKTKEPEKKKEPDCKTKKPEKKKEPEKKEDCKSKEPEKKKEPDCKAKEAPKKKEPECKSKEPEKKGVSGSGTGKSQEKLISVKKMKIPPSCIDLLLEREGMKKSKANKKLNKISGGGPRCPKEPVKDSSHAGNKSRFWGRVSLMGVLPLVAILALLVFSTHKEGERPEFKNYPHMYKRTKSMFFGHPNKTAFHNKHWNALPPDGYEDEIDVDAAGKTAETDEEREQRLKDFGTVRNEWKKMDDKRTAEAKKAQAAAEKEAKKARELAEKEEKKAQAAAEKERKKQEAAEEKERKKQAAEAEKERKKQEAEEKKKAKEAQKVDFAFLEPSVLDDIPPGEQ